MYRIIKVLNNNGILVYHNGERDRIRKEADTAD